MNTSTKSAAGLLEALAAVTRERDALRDIALQQAVVIGELSKGVHQDAPIIEEIERVNAAFATLTPTVPSCTNCHRCAPNTLHNMRMILCPTCGNKRCPKANDCANACTGSNEPGQPGGAYPKPTAQGAQEQAL